MQYACPFYGARYLLESLSRREEARRRLTDLIAACWPTRMHTYYVHGASK